MCPMTTRSAPRAPIAPIAETMSSARSPGEPSASSSRLPGSRTPFMISSSASSPASLCARSITTVKSRTVYMFIRPGLFSPGVNELRPSITAPRGNPSPSAAEAAASAFSTL